MSRTWFSFKNQTGPRAEISIYDEIGFWGITAKDFHDELKNLGPGIKDIDLFINSPGGDVFAGFSIYNMLDRHKANIHVHIDGIAASIASVIAMAGDSISIAENGMMMIHNPTGFVVGESRDMRQLATVLDKIKNSIIDAYAKKSGKDREEIADLMDDETWFDADEAVAENFADEVTNSVPITNNFDLSKFNYPPSMEDLKKGNGVPSNKGKSTMTDKNQQKTDPKPEDNPAPAPTAAATPAAPAPAAPAAPVATATETEDQMRERITKELNDRREQITNACELAGRPDLVNGFLAENKSLPEVLAALKEAAPKGRKAPANTNGGEISARHAPSGDGSGATIDTAAIYNKWNGAKVRRG